MKVLIVDDVATNLKLLRLNLEAEGHTALEARDGLAALQILKREEVDAIVSDVLMPRMDGYRFCHEVRRNTKLRELPFIVYSSTYGSPADEKLAREFGADEFIRKPSSIENILEAIRKLTSTSPADRRHSCASVSELSVVKRYSELLVKKLEQSNVELQQTRYQLLGTNQELLNRSEQLQSSKEALRKSNEELESRVRMRTGQLEAAHRELEAFSDSVLNELRATLQAVNDGARLLSEESTTTFDATGLHRLEQIERATGQAGERIDAMVNLSKLTQARLDRAQVDLGAMAGNILKRLRLAAPQRKAEITIAPRLTAYGDASLLGLALEHLLANAWKFTGQREQARIEFGAQTRAGCVIFFVRDNGVGFDPGCAEGLFGVFQRLHAAKEFPGIGIGLAIVRRIVERHGGSIRAEAQLDKGAVFYFTLEPDSHGVSL